MHTQWAIMCSFYAIALGMGMCGPALMTLLLEPMKETCGLATGIVFCRQSIIGAVASSSSLIAREWYGIRGMFLAFMVFHVAGQAIFWIGLGSNYDVETAPETAKRTPDSVT